MGKAYIGRIRSCNRHYMTRMSAYIQRLVRGAVLFALVAAPTMPAWAYLDAEAAYRMALRHHHPLGAKGVGESATVGAPPAIANAVVDALSHLGVTHIDIPITPPKVWQILNDSDVAA